VASSLRTTSSARWASVLLISIFGLGAYGFAPAARADETVYACGSYPNNVFYEADAAGFEESETCGGLNGTMEIVTSSSPTNGSNAYWATNTPSGLLIDTASVGHTAVHGLNDGGSYGGGLFWGPNSTDGVQAGDGTTGLGPFGVDAYDPTGFPSSDFGFQITCGSGCTQNDTYFEAGDVVLTVEETQGPYVSGGGLWNASGWVRGTWPITVTGDSPSGICSLSAFISGDPVTASGAMSPNQTVWHQCNGSLSSSIDTTLAYNGADTLNISDIDAAGETDGTDEPLNVDNETPTVTLSGPATALSTAGTQDVSVAVGTGPSGAYGADCSVDGGPQTFYAGASSQVPVSGVGEHTVTCTGVNNAMSAGGVRASSPPESFTVDIQQPTVEAITFSKIADALKCRIVTKRVKVLGKPRTIRLHGRKVQVRSYHTVKHHVRRCEARTVKRKVLVELKRDGKVVRRHGHVVRVRRVQRVVLLPHRVHRTLRNVPHGRGTTVSGVLLLSDGTPVAGQQVTILGAANNAAHAFGAISSATTSADGFWVAKIPAGPSRVLEAEYGGTSTTAAASSTLVRTVVPARIRILSATPRVAWGATAKLRGRVYGGYIPRGGINIRLRYGYRGQSITYGVKTHVGPAGRFTTTFTFGPGDPRDHIRFHFQFATLPGGNYPFHTAESNTVSVLVGGHPRSTGHHRQKRS
jgi:hypothetical protein